MSASPVVWVSAVRLSLGVASVVHAALQPRRTAMSALDAARHSGGVAMVLSLAALISVAPALAQSAAPVAVHHIHGLAVDQGDPDAQYRLAQRLIGGSGVARDIPRARTLLQTAASAGSAGAMRELALAYADDGILFDHSDDLSRQWESRARAAPQPDSRAPEDERAFAATLPSNLERIRTRYAHANGGDPAAQQAIAREILAGAHDDPTLVAKAYGWLERAAASGAADAQFAVAEYYLGLPNPTSAQQDRGRQWMIAAADTGHQAALRRLITAYKKGDFGLGRDLERAKAYGERLLAALEADGVLPNQGPWLSASWDYADTVQQLKRER